MTTQIIHTQALAIEVQTKNVAMPAASHVKTSVVIPTLNEAKNLPHVLPQIPAWVDEVVIVDGNSKDNTVEVARQLRPDVKIVMQQGKGKGSALRQGFAAATGDIIVMIDADGSTDPKEIPMFVGALLSGADFVKGSRFLQGGGTSDMELHRMLGNLGLTTFVKMLFGGGFTDLCYGYNAFWSRVLPKLNLDCDGFEIETLMNVRALKAKLKVMEVPSFEAERIYGTSNLNAMRDGMRVLKTILREYTARWTRATARKEEKTAKRTPLISFDWERGQINITWKQQHAKRATNSTDLGQYAA